MTTMTKQQADALRELEEHTAAVAKALGAIVRISSADGLHVERVEQPHDLRADGIDNFEVFPPPTPGASWTEHGIRCRSFTARYTDEPADEMGARCLSAVKLNAYNAGKLGQCATCHSIHVMGKCPYCGGQVR